MSEEYLYELKIPHDRIPVLVGTDGTIKKEIEEKTNCKLDVDSSEGEVTIDSEDSLAVFTAKEVVQAIARGFNPKYALLLTKSDYSLEIVNLHEVLGKNQKKITRMKGRVIGRNGKSRKTIESLTDTHICVYGKTLSIIGDMEDVGLARKAVFDLLEGANHASVFKFLEKQNRMKKISDLKDKRGF